MERNPELIGKLRTYISDFQTIKPKLFDYFEGGSDPVFPLAPESDRGVALLLCFCALYQNISEKRLVRFLAYLWKEYGTDLFKLNRLPFQDLQERIQKLDDLRDWVLWAKAPGILRSVCDFFYQHGRIVPWMHGQKDAEACVHILADEIFLMGKTSSFKSKPRYFIWLLTQLPGAEPDGFWNERTLLPISAGHIRLLREFGPLKNRRNSPWTTPEEKLSYCNRFYNLLFPGKSWMVYAALDGYLKSMSGFNSPLAAVPAPKMWRCREVLHGCLNCVLVPECPGREEV